MFTFAGCQIPVTRDIEKNIKEIKKAIDWAKENSVEIIATPECALSGYMWKPDSVDDPRLSLVISGLEEIKKYSKETGVDIVLGTAFVDDVNHWANTQKFIVSGEVIHTHYKNIVFGEELKYYNPGTTVGSIQYKQYKIAGLICNDFWSNPILWPDASGVLLRKLKDDGVDILFASVNVPKETGPEDCFFRWHVLCTEMFSMAGGWTTVVCDNPYLMEGDEYQGRTISQSGICNPNMQWIKSREHGTDYFKQSRYDK